MTKRLSPVREGGTWLQPHMGDDVRLWILRAVEDGWRSDGRSPSYREIRATTGLRSLAHVKYHIDELVAEGLLRRLPGSRGLLPVRPAGLRILGTIAAGDPLDLFEEGSMSSCASPSSQVFPLGTGSPTSTVPMPCACVGTRWWRMGSWMTTMC